MDELNTYSSDKRANTELNLDEEKVPEHLTSVEISDNIQKQLIIDEISKIEEITYDSVSKTATSDIQLNYNQKLNSEFINLINNLILEKNYDSITDLFQIQGSKNIELLNENTSDIIQICVKHLTDSNYNNDLSLYVCVENLLKCIAQYTGPEEVLFELLAIIETTKSDNTLTTALKALQICLQRQKDKRPRGLEWALNSILNFINDLPIPDYLTKGYDLQQERLLEQNEEIYRILTNYITITLFYEPLYNEFIELENFTKNQHIRKDILTCFILQLLGKPLALLDLSSTKKTKTNTYSLQCATTFTNNLTALLDDDPYFLLHYVQLRSDLPKKSSTEELDTEDYFTIDEKCPLLSIGIYYYMIICEEIKPKNMPIIYNPMYIFETCLLLIIELFDCNEPNIQYKGILLGQKIIKNIDGIQLRKNALQLKVHLKCYTSLINIIIYSDFEHIRKSGMTLFQNYFNNFDDDGKFYILKKLIKTTKHNGLLGYLMISYKNLIDKQLKNDGKLSENYCGHEFKNMLLNFICKLNNNIETDLMENYDHIISALNIVRYFVIADKENLTGFWNFLDEIKNVFLEPLRLTIHLTRNNYKAEECRIQSGKIYKNPQLIQLSLLSGENLPNFTKDQKLKMISCAFINFDLMESLLARVNECIDNNSSRNKDKK